MNDRATVTGREDIVDFSEAKETPVLFARKKPPAVADPGEPDRAGRVPLHYAAMGADNVLIERLIASGQDPNAQDNNGWTPLHFAAQERSLITAAGLVEHGADVNKTDKYGNGPLSTAVFNCKGDNAVVIYLRSHGADPLQTNRAGTTPLSLARTIANYDVRDAFADLP